MKNEIEMKLQDLKCNWSFSLFDDLLDKISDELDNADTNEDTKYYKEKLLEIKSIKKTNRIELLESLSKV